MAKRDMSCPFRCWSTPAQSKDPSNDLVPDEPQYHQPAERRADGQRRQRPLRRLVVRAEQLDAKRLSLGRPLAAQRDVVEVDVLAKRVLVENVHAHELADLVLVRQGPDQSVA